MIIGFLIGMILNLIYSYFSNRIYFLTDFKRELLNPNILQVSRNLLNSNSIFRKFLKNKYNKNLVRDMITINNLTNIVSEKNNNKTKPLSITCATTNNLNVAFSTALLLSDCLSKENSRILISDFTYKSKSVENYLIKNNFKKSEKYKEILLLKENISYKKCNFNDNDKILECTSQYKNDFDVIIVILNNTQNSLESIKKMQNSDFFIFIGVANKIKYNETKLIRDSLGTNMSKCAAGIFIQN